jgi:sigma-B regulation protein RsbU (phosphoserine phosphatase)
MPPQVSNLRAWLEVNGLLPKGRLALITLYLLGLDLLLYILGRVSDLTHGSWGKNLGGWIIFLTAVIIALGCVLAARWASAHMLWRLRNRLIVTYIFIGVIPLVLLLGLAGLGFYLFAGQFATFIVTTRLQMELKSLQAGNSAIARSIAADLAANREPAPQEYDAGDRQISAWLDGSAVLPNAGSKSAERLPAYLPAEFMFVARDQQRLFLKAGTNLRGGRGTLKVVSSRPFDQGLLANLASDLGEVTLYASGLNLREVDQGTPLTASVQPSSDRKSSKLVLDTGSQPLKPTLTAGNIPPPSRAFDGQVNFATAISVVNWRNGDSSQPAAMSVQTRLSALYGPLFSSLGDFAPTIELFLVVVAIIFAVIELIALWIGTRLTRSMTGAVAQLYQATIHVNRGDFSHRIPIRSRDQIAALAGSFNLMTESIEKLVEEQKEKQRLENEITIAQEVQAQLFPRVISQLPGLEVHGFCRPARSVSGDYYDFLPLGKNRIVLAVGDVSGKGISAALLMATIHSAVRAYSMEGIPALRHAQAVGAGVPSMPELSGAEVSPGLLLSLLNNQLYHSTPMEKYATLFLATYEDADRRLTFSNAGHLPPLVLNEKGGIRRLEDGGTVVGLFEDMTYDENSVELRPGEIFLAYSDGVTEPENDFGEFGEERLIELVHENRHQPLSRISEIVTAAVDDWIGAAEQPDDVTLVLARAR